MSPSTILSSATIAHWIQHHQINQQTSIQNAILQAHSAHLAASGQNTGSQYWPHPAAPTPSVATEDWSMPLNDSDVFMPPQSPQPTMNTSKNVPFRQLVNYNGLKLNKSICKNFEKLYTVRKENEYDFCTNNSLVGIEIEVENLANTISPLHCYWQVKSDGSLRNNGYEFVSQPLEPSQINLALQTIFDCITQNNKPDFSNRTSIHIHLNCREMTQDQIWNLVILYCVFEKHFYKFAGTKRLNSIFCVPIYRSNILQNLNHIIYGFSPDWHKYCALNLLPLVPNSVTGTYGTIEFRHLYGTEDQVLIKEWINTILHLQQLAMNMSKEELEAILKEMNTTSSYKSLYYTFLGDMKPLLSSNKDFEDCISNVKRELFGNSYEKTLKVSTNSPYWITAQQHQISG